MNQSQSSYLIPDDDDNPFAGINVNYESMPDWAGEDVPLSAYEGEYIPDMAEEGHYSDGPASTSAQMGRFTSTRKPTIAPPRSEAHTSELQSLMRLSYAVFCLQKKKKINKKIKNHFTKHDCSDNINRKQTLSHPT